jgi:O-antigen/teichoic acid export membrane protein
MRDAHVIRRDPARAFVLRPLMRGSPSPAPGALKRDPMTEEEGDSALVQTFSSRVFTLFATSVFTTGAGVVVGFMLARVLGPGGKGDFYLITLLPVTIMVLIQLGLPQALGFYSARGQTKGIITKTVILTAVLAAPALVIVVALMPVLRATILNELPPEEILLGLVVLPLALHATFTTAVVLGRQAVRSYAITSVGIGISGMVLYIALVYILRLEIKGALLAFFLLYCITAAGWFIGSVRASAAVPDPADVSYRELFSYGLPIYPGTFTSFFSNRVDVYLLAFLLTDPSAPIGYYSLAVTLAQLVFFFPSAVSSLFFPHVAGSAREEADRQVPMVARVTLLLTGAMAIALIPGALILVKFLLPAFEPSLPPLLILLPGVVALSQSKVVSSYVTGLGMTGWISTVNVGALVLNVAMNLLLIPRVGILGAAAASLISYTATAIAISVLAARLANRSITDFWLPRWSDVRFAATTMVGTGRRLLRRAPSQR